MNITKQIAKHIREIYFGGNWTCSNLKEHLSDVTWQQATAQIYSFNTIAVLICHIHCYVKAVTNVLENGGEPDVDDKLTFTHPPVLSAEDWENLLSTIWSEAEEFAGLVEQLTDEILDQEITSDKHDSYYRYLHGIIEHANYHLGQIVLIKKILLETKPNQ